MLNLRKIILFSAFLVPLLLPAQQKPNMDNYQPPQSNGPLPPNFLISTVDKYEQDRQKIQQNQDKKMQKAEDDFYLQTNYSVDQMCFSGEVLVNDTMGQYVNRVADTLLWNDKETRKNISFYILRSPIVNAFTTDQGIIFVTVGLLTRLDNEAELAFVLGHEITHYKHHHVYIGYVEGVKMQQGMGQYEATTFENRYLKRHRYARSQESQADDEGFDMMVAAGYDPHAAIKAFDILALADYPFSDTTFNKSFFETNYLIFPSKYQPDTVKGIRPDNEDEDDDLATHPSTYKRRKAIIHKFNKLQDTTGALFKVSESMFWRVKAIARFEECSEHSQDQEFSEAMYSDYVMQSSYPDNYYLEKEMVRAMYASVIEKNKTLNLDDLMALFQSLFIIGGPDDRPVGEQGRLKGFVSKADATGWNIAALHYAWDVHKKYPDDPDISYWCTGLFRELTLKNKVRIGEFEKNDTEFVHFGNRILKDTAIVNHSKIATPAERYQLALDHMSKDSIDTYHYWQFAFIDDLKDSAFVAQFKEATVWADSVHLQDSLWYMQSTRAQDKSKGEIESDLSGPQGITKLVAVNPVYIAYIDHGDDGDQEVDVRNSLDGHSLLVDEMKKDAKMFNLDLTLLDESGLDTSSVDRFNDLSVASQWFAQRDNYTDHQVLPYSQEKMKALAQKYGTPYFMWSAYITYKGKRRGNLWRALSFLVTPLAPHIAYRMLTPHEDVYYIAIIYDVNTGYPVFVQKTQMSNQHENKSRLRLHVFDLFHQITEPKKKKK
ncbi:MAG TPA: M48 family metalloprotease [Bacteroidia bacterium]|nr:M48 family metalloprotease [Bacteroidia bacterium]